MDADIYDALAPFYRDYAARRSAYLAAVDRFVLAHLPPGARSHLDVGAGDGVRGMALSRQAGLGLTVLCDRSAEMAARCRRLQPAEVWHGAAEDLPDSALRFDVITCLWNVLGHLPGRAARVRALAGMARLLAPGGRIYFDVNNRHNAAAYGVLRVLGRIAADAVRPDERRGDTSFTWEVGGRSIAGTGHLFTPAEMAAVLRAAGLRALCRVAVDYADGRVSRAFWKGQLLYVAVPRGGMSRLMLQIVGGRCSAEPIGSGC